MKLENTELLFQKIVAEHPDTEKDLRRLISRVCMDCRNAFSREMSDIEIDIQSLRASDTTSS